MDDAFKPATPLTDHGMLYSDSLPLSDFSQGSVATHLRCGGIFSDGIISNFLLILAVKRSKIG